MKSEDMIRLIKLTAKAPMVELSVGVPNKLMMDERMVNPINNPANTQIWDFVNFQEVLNPYHIFPPYKESSLRQSYT